MNFLEFAAWGAYLTSMGTYLVTIGMATQIGWFYAIQGIVSIFMPALMGIVADRWIPAQRLLGYCHLLAGLLMLATAYAGQQGLHDLLFPIYALSVAFYMPTLALSNSVAYNGLTQAGMDTVKHFPPIRVFGTIGFICTMWLVDVLGFQANQNQFVASAAVSLLLFLYTFTLPHCPVVKSCEKKSLADALGLRAFALLKQKKMAIFFCFSMLLGVSLQITNGFANPFITSFKDIPQYADTFGVNHANMLISLSQISETCCILLIPFFMKRYGIKNVMLIAMMGLGVALRPLRPRQSWQWRVDVHSLDDRLWRGLRLLQHLRIALCRAEHGHEAAKFRPRTVYADDQWYRRDYWHTLRPGGGQRLHRQWRDAVGRVLVRLRRLRPRGGRRLCADIPTQNKKAQ